MIFSTLILSLLIKWHFQSSTQLDKKSLYIPFFNLYLFTSHLGSIFDHHLFCNSLPLVLLSSLFGAAIIFCLGFTNAFQLVLVLCLLILEPILSTSSTVHKTLQYLLPLKIWSLFDDLQCLSGQNQLLSV